MKVQAFFSDIDLTKTKLLRHNMSREDVYDNYHLGPDYFEVYQSRQRPGRFGDSEYIISFLGTEGTNGVFIGCYKITDCVPYRDDLAPVDYAQSSPCDDDVFYKMVKTDTLSELEHRLVIDWGKSTRGWCQNGTTEKEVLCIRPAISEFAFTSYDKVVLSYRSLKAIVDNPRDHEEWKTRLSSVAGIYLITDTKTGLHYVGSASSETNGIWGRWAQYINTKHGGNKRLIELLEIDPKYCHNFQFSILDVFPIKRDKHEILEYEQLYKKKLCSIRFGLNDN